MRTARATPFRFPDRGTHGLLQLHRRLLQSHPAALRPGVSLAHLLRTGDENRAATRQPLNRPLNRGNLSGLTGSPEESGARRREKGLAKAGNARVRRGMLQLAWRFLRFQEGSGLAGWYRARTADARAGTRKTMIVALARKLLVALWRLVTTGEVPEGVVLRPAA